jgi:hypothetical protein
MHRLAEPDKLRPTNELAERLPILVRSIQIERAHPMYTAHDTHSDNGSPHPLEPFQGVG